MQGRSQHTWEAEEVPYMIRDVQASDIDDSAQTHYETWSTCYAGLWILSLEYSILHPKLRKERQQICDNAAEGNAIALVAEWKAVNTISPPKPLSDPSISLRLVGHCDIGLPDDYSHFNLTTHPSSPTNVILEDTTNTIEIYSLYVHPSMHSTGCAQSLFACAAREGLHEYPHTQRMIVMTFEVNTRARRYYEKMGGKLYKLLSGFPEDGKFWNIMFFEWLDLPLWVQKWEQMYLKEKNRKEINAPNILYGFSQLESL